MGKIGLWMYRNDGGARIEEQLRMALEARGHEVMSGLDMRTFYSHCGEVHSADGRVVSSCDVLFHMNADEQSDNQCDQLFALERAGVSVTNAPAAYALARDKFAANQRIRAAGLRAPDAILALPAQLRALAPGLFERWPALVVKPRRRHGGYGILRFTELSQFCDYLQACDSQVNLYIERFVPFGDCDQRVEVIAGRAIGGYARRRTHPFKTNVSSGGLMTASPPSAALCRLAERAAALLGLDSTIVDFVRGRDDGLDYLLEVNPIPGIFVEAAMRVSEKTRVRAVDTSYALDELKVTLIAEQLDAMARRRSAP
jgi:ribosomal protein S6--L-glutamate ligase